MPTALTIVNLHRVQTLPANTVKVDRGSDWGNPSVMHSEMDRDHVCESFRRYAEWRLRVEPQWLDPIIGKHLACWCAPKRCHTEILRELANHSLSIRSLHEAVSQTDDHPSR